MKTLIHSLTVALLLSVAVPAQLKAENSPVTSVVTEKLENNNSERATIARLKAIRQLTKTRNLSKAEKKELRNEVLAIKAKHQGGPVIFISTGALILIIILLIILL